MSINVTKRVWENSSARGGELLVLLAIADHVGDSGWAWPGVDSLGKKTRQTPRHVTRCLTNLAAAGELEINHQRGPHGTNRYRVLCYPKLDVPEIGSPTCQGDITCQGDKGVLQMSPESSEPSSVPTHTANAVAVTNNANDWPSEPEVFNHAKTYPGNVTLAAPALAISEDWARNYWTWRTLSLEKWPRQWKEEMFRRFEQEWREGRPSVRGARKRNSAHGAEFPQLEKLPMPVKSGALTLSEMRKAVN